MLLLTNLDQAHQLEVHTTRRVMHDEKKIPLHKYASGTGISRLVDRFFISGEGGECADGHFQNGSSFGINPRISFCKAAARWYSMMSGKVRSSVSGSRENRLSISSSGTRI